MQVNTLTSLVLSCCIPSLALEAQDPAPALIGYWHNWNDAGAPYIELDQVDPRYNVIEIAFAEPLAGTTYDMQFVPSITAPATFMAQVAAHQGLGHKVLISIGGANATVQLNSDAERDQFVASMTDILTTYGFDGIDIDLEGASVNLSGGTIAAPNDPTINRLIAAIGSIADQFELANGIPMMLTMAPETAYVQGGMSAFGGIWGAYLPIIDALRDRLDILQVQLYNSGSMFGIDGGIYTQGTADFIVSQTEAVLQGFSTSGGFFAGLPPEKVAIGLPACSSAAGGGFTDTVTVRAAVEYLLGIGAQPGSYTLVQPGGYPNLRGMMTWSVNWDAVASCNGANAYAENYERIFGDLVTDSPDRMEREWSLHPNPATNTIVLDIDLPVAGTIEFIVMDVRGRTILTFKKAVTTGMNQVALDVEPLDAGPYFIASDPNGDRRITRFMKN